jgi:hypothetical protein
MGGTGSGRSGSRPVVDGCRSPDVNRLHREGSLRPGWTGTLRWSRDGEDGGSIGVRAAQGRITLTYRYRWCDEEWQDVEEPVSITQTPYHFGGLRPWSCVLAASTVCSVARHMAEHHTFRFRV